MTADCRNRKEKKDEYTNKYSPIIHPENLSKVISYHMYYVQLCGINIKFFANRLEKNNNGMLEN